MIYRPAETALLKSAKKAGCRTANGLGMLLHQGAKAFEIWTGKSRRSTSCAARWKPSSAVHSLESPVSHDVEDERPII